MTSYEERMSKKYGFFSDKKSDKKKPDLKRRGYA